MLAAIQSYIIANYKAKDFCSQLRNATLDLMEQREERLWIKVTYYVTLYSSQHNGHPCLFADVGGGAVRELG